jgi:hypothetical protein
MYNRVMETTETKKYIMWSDGVLTSFGIKGDTVDGRITVQNPVSIHFQVVNEPVYDEKGDEMVDEYGQPVMKGGLRWEMTPYVFGACLTEPSKNVWSINPTYILLEGAEFDAQLTKHYETLVGLCGGKFPAPAPTEPTPDGGEEVGD